MNELQAQYEQQYGPGNYVPYVLIQYWAMRGMAYLADPAGPAVVIRHKDCDEPVCAMLQCIAGHHPLTARDTHPAPGPGVRRAVS